MLLDRKTVGSKPTEEEKMSRKIFIFDTTLRDGEQSLHASLNVREKLEISRQLAKLNVDVIEAGNPISSPGDFEAVQAIAQEVRGPVICALARCVEADIEQAGQAVQNAEKAMIHVYIGASEIHMKGQLRKTAQEVLNMAARSVAQAKSLCEMVEFSPMDVARADLGYICRLVQAAIEAGATVINIPDTVGYAVPEEFGGVFRALRSRVPKISCGDVRLSVHCHDDLGMATANSLVAVRCGAGQVECTINGLGERAGNTALEEIVMAIKTRADYCLDVYTDIKTELLVPTSELVSRNTGVPVPFNKAIVGSNAFSHSSGVHQDGMLKERTTFEIMRPEDVGRVKSDIVLTARSGRHALQHRLQDLGYDIAGQELETVYERFLKVADAKKKVWDEDLHAIVEDERSTTPQVFSISYLKVSSESSETQFFSSSATVGLWTRPQPSDRKATLIRKKAHGDGPVDAIYKAIDKITGVAVELADYSLHGITKGKDAMGEVTVRVQVDDRTVVGRGASTNIIEASAKAYVDAINKLLEGQKPVFSPQMIAGSRTGLSLTGTYGVPRPPDGKILLVGVKAGWIAFFYGDAEALPETEEPYKTGGGWQYYIVPEGTVAVKFPQYQVEDHSGAHLYGPPEFHKTKD